MQVAGKTLDDLGLKKYLETYILSDLNGSWSENPDSRISWNKVTIDEKDEQGKVRTDGFVVKAEGDQAKIEKFVDVGVFRFYDLVKDRAYKRKFTSLLADNMKCKLGGISCEVKETRNYLSTDRYDYNYRIECTKQRDYTGDGNYRDLDETQIPDEQFKNADEIVKRIKDALQEIEKRELNGYGSLKAYRDADAVMYFNIDSIDAHVDMESRSVQGDCCVFICTGKKNYCDDEKYEEDYRVNVNIKGSIHVKELKVVAGSMLRETGQGKEVCVKTPIMIKTGEVVPMETATLEFDIPYTITLAYTEGCRPAPVVDSDAGETFDAPFPGFYMNAESIRFSPTPVECEWGPMDASYKPVCAGMKKVYDECYCKGGCSTVINCPSTDPRTWSHCPGHPEKEYCVGCSKH